MDMTVRFWDSEYNKVVERYFHSDFLGHATAADMLYHFNKGIAELDPSCLIQVSMDGPNVNWKFYCSFCEERKAAELPDLLNIGSCSLHVVHGSFQNGAKESGWNLANILRALWQLFHDTPARREDFNHITGTNVYPLQFCQHRWVEDVRVAERALHIWPHINKYVKTVIIQGKAPTSSSFMTVATACDDTLIQAKLEFFISVAKPLQEFLIKFQTEAPMAPFLGLSLKELLLALMGRFLKKEVLEAADTFRKLAIIDTEDKNRKNPKHVELGFAAHTTIKKVAEKKAASELRLLTFKNDCVKFLLAIVLKLLEKCPLKYPLVQCLDSLIPLNLVSSSSQARVKFQKLLQILLNGKRRSAEECDEILVQYNAFVIEVKQNHLVEFPEFKESNDRLDEFYWRYLKEPKYKKLWSVFLTVFTLSHSQAGVERGFSVNSDLLIENMKERTLVACRSVYDCVMSSTVSHFSEISFTPRLKRNVRAARMHYHLYLEDQKKLAAGSEISRKRKAIEADISATESKRRLLLESMKCMRKEADDLAVEAEKKT